MAKASKVAAEYIPHASTRLCRTCDHYEGGSCTKVAGVIAPDATCVSYYQKMTAGKK